jgi:hypothetical protein
MCMHNTYEILCYAQYVAMLAYKTFHRRPCGGNNIIVYCCLPPNTKNKIIHYKNINI